ncbi:MAG: hypothetical protein LC656_05850 [Sphingomonadales bacterium]|nr:hypothetical protein [Sphingomonadales bacterium]
MLAAQRAYGSDQPCVRSVPGAALGVSASGTKPIRDDDAERAPSNGYIFSADMRIDNRDELLAALGGAGPTSNLTDNDILNRALGLWGENTFGRLIGDFAIAGYSPSQQRLTLARDTTGQRPLFYARRDDRVAFSSMPAGLLALPDIWRGFDRRALARILMDQPVDGGATAFADIRVVPPGHKVTLTAQSETIASLWEPDFSPLEFRRRQDYVDLYRETLDRSVGSRLRGVRGRVATHLSSGFDSSAVASTAARLRSSDEPIIALTAAPPAGFVDAAPPRNRIADESPLAAITARRHHMEHVVVRTARPLIDCLRVQVRIHQNPVRNHINVGWLSACQVVARQRGATILLDADLGNLTLNAGGLSVLADIRQRSGLAHWWREMRQTKRNQDVRWHGLLFNSFPPPAPVQRRLLALFQDVQPPEKLTYLRRELFPKAAPRARVPAPSCGYIDSFMDRWLTLRSRDYGTVRKGVLAETGLDTSDPMADRRMIELSMRLPYDQLLRDGISRPLAKEALSDRLPPEILHSPVRGYQSADWLDQLDRDAIGAAIEEISANATVRGLIDTARLKRSLDNWPRPGENSLSAYDQYASHMLKTLAVGMFIVEFDRPPEPN